MESKLIKAFLVCSLAFIFLYLNNISQFLALAVVPLFYFDRYKVLGFLLPLASWQDPRLLLFVAGVFLILEKDSLRIFRPGLPLLYIFFVWLCFDIIYEFNIEQLFNLKYQAFGWTNITLVFLTYFIFLVFLGFRRDLLNSKFFYSFCLGLFLSQILTVMQILGLFHQFTPNLTEFWIKQGRFSGTFSDPNAFGIFSVLAIGILLSLGEKKFYLLAAVQFLLALSSGSRSFALGMILLASFILYAKYRKIFIILLVAGIGLLATHNILWLQIEAYKNALGILPDSVVRISNALILENFQSTVFSRFVFIKLNIAMFLDHYFAGVGFNHFRSFLPLYKDLLDIPIEAWSDNTNNFYFGILSETGLIGFAAFLFFIFHTRVRPNLSVYYRGTFYTLIILLFLGPHLEFSEVMIFSAVIFSVVLERKEILIKPTIVVLSAGIVISAVFLYSLSVPRGMYQQEMDQGRIFRWVSSPAIVPIKCKNEKAKFAIRALNPDLSSDPLVVNIANEVKYKRDIIISDNNWRQMQLDCKQDKASSLLMLDTSRTWRPSDIDSSSVDHRDLALQLNF